LHSTTQKIFTAEDAYAGRRNTGQGTAGVFAGAGRRRVWAKKQGWAEKQDGLKKQSWKQDSVCGCVFTKIPEQLSMAGNCPAVGWLAY
jgi:hypothetical protein